MRSAVDRYVSMQKREALMYASAAIASGYQVRVNYGDGDWGTDMTDSLYEVRKALFACDEEWLVVYKNGQRVGWFFFVYGNEPGVVVNDYHIAMEPIYQACEAKRAKFEDMRDPR